MVWGSDNVHWPMNTDCRNEADSSCYMCAGMYTVYLNKCISATKKKYQLVSLEFFIGIKSFLSHYGPGVDSTSNRNEYQEHFLGVKAAGA